VVDGFGVVAHHGDHPVDPRIRPELLDFASIPSCRVRGQVSAPVRKWRGATYEIMVRQEPGVTGRVRRLVVDGKSVDTNVVPEAPAGSTVRIEAVLEASSSD